MRGIADYIKNIEKLINATKQGKLIWTKQNPTTFYFSSKTTNGENSIVSLQAVKDSFMGENLMLQITNSSTKETMLSLDSSTYEIRSVLTELFEEVSYSIEKKGIDFFNDITGSL